MHQPKWHIMQTRSTGRIRFRLKPRWLFVTQLLPEVEVEDVMQRYPGEFRTSEPYWKPVAREDWQFLIGMGPFQPDPIWAKGLYMAEGDS